ncbi:DNA-3-methyladenine glycosylase family protein [Ilumatobacter sp.]|uniref:DNA-3-methyladenine glycosylase family protein n=1 Tax=Ilumatobacter sp. TaxID=1967498 RepID=UPI003B524366
MTSADVGPRRSAPATRVLQVGEIDLPTTLQMIGIYSSDPTFRTGPGSFAKAVLTPDGPGTIHLAWDRTGRVEVSAWGSGAAWLLERSPAWVGLTDDVSGFDPSPNRRVRDLWRRHAGIRLPASGVIWQELVLVLLGQRVTTREAARSWNRLCRTWGEPAPGPVDLLLPPPPEVVAALSYVDLHTLNVDRRRADAILLAARRASRLEEAAAMSTPDAITRLSALPGLGVWTATATVLASHGDPDTVLLRDYGMPTLVNYAFTGDATHLDPDRGGDEIMLGHLEPWRGHRQRIIRLLYAARITAPRRGARRANPDIRTM